MKKWKIILASLVALLVLIVTPLSIMAQQAPVTPAVRPELKGALAIVAPRVVRPGEEMSLTVFLRKDQSAVANAGIWAVTRDQAEAIRAAVKALRSKLGAAATEADYQAAFGANGNLIGRTNENGKLTHTFNNPGHRLLIAFKTGYAPDFSGLAVREVLAISAPKKAAPGADVILTVNQKGTSSPVGDATIWQVKWENAKALKDALAKARTDNQGNIPDAAVASAMSAQSVSLGKTGANGQLTHKFNDAGRYLLIATKDGCVPGFAGIVIAVPQPALTAAVTPKVTPNSTRTLK